jgi:hypothetical protein
MSAASEDIIRHIIRDIVTHSTTTLKQKRLHATSTSANSNDLTPEPVPPAPLTPLPEASHLFSSGIKSHVSPTIVSDTLAAFVVRAVVLDPKNDFRIERELTKEEVQRLITVRYHFPLLRLP